MPLRFDNPRRTLDLFLQFLFIDGRIEVIATNLETLVATRLHGTDWSVALVGADTVHLTVCAVNPPSRVRLKLLGTANGDHDLEGPAMLVELAPSAGATGIRFAVEVAHQGQEQRVALEIGAPGRTDLLSRPTVHGGPRGPKPNPFMPPWGHPVHDMRQIESLLRERADDIAAGAFAAVARELTTQLHR